jgi:hypothetical protein
LSDRTIIDALLRSPSQYSLAKFLDGSGPALIDSRRIRSTDTFHDALEFSRDLGLVFVNVIDQELQVIFGDAQLVRDLSFAIPTPDVLKDAIHRDACAGELGTAASVNNPSARLGQSVRLSRGDYALV